MAKSKVKTKSKEKVAPSKTKEKAVSRNKECLRELLDAVKLGEQANFEAARLLAEAEKNTYYLESSWGQKTDIYEWAEAQFGWKSRKTRSLINARRFIEKNGITKKQMDSIGWAKLARLAESKLVDDSNLDDWLGKAEGLSMRKFEEAIKASKGKPYVEPGSVHVVQYKMIPDDASVIMNAITECKEILGIENDGQCLKHICMEWINSKGAKPEKLELSSAISWIEECYSVKVSYVEVEPDEPEFEDEEADEEDEKPKGKKKKKGKKDEKPAGKKDKKKPKGKKAEEVDDSDEDPEEEDEAEEPEEEEEAPKKPPKKDKGKKDKGKENKKKKPKAKKPEPDEEEFEDDPDEGEDDDPEDPDDDDTYFPD